MDIRTKLALALVSVALLGMALLGTFAYQTSSSLLQEISIRQLDALAESKRRDLVKVQQGWRDQVRLINSRTQLRRNLKDYLVSGDEVAIRSLVRIIEDAATSVSEVDQIRIMDPDGNEVASYGHVTANYLRPAPSENGDVTYGSTFMSPAGDARVVFSSFLVLDGERIGVIEVVFDAAELRSVTDDHTGLGETGEAMVVIKEDEATALVLNPLRHGQGDKFTRMPYSEASDAIKLVLSGDASETFVHTVDYRGVDVWAASRYVPELAWGLVVKVDEEEEKQRAHSLRDALVDISLALSAFAIIGGTLLGFYLARPIQALAEVVGRIRKGETHLRADASGDDEVAYLAESINELMDQWKSDSKRND